MNTTEREAFIQWNRRKLFFIAFVCSFYQIIFD